MRVVRQRPPLWDEISKAFPAAVHRPGIMFCWGNEVYMPLGGELTDALAAHERIHSIQQGNDPEGWWLQYIADPKFRLEQEIPAHQAEYNTLCDGGVGRAERRRYAMALAKRLSSPIYGSLITRAEAKRLIAR